MIHLELSPRNNEKGFTLIEILIYAAITTLIMSFATLAAYQLISSSNRVRHQKELAENQRFLEQKIFWALQSNSAINAPTAGATSTSLSIDKLNFASNPLVFSVDASTTLLKIGSATALPVTDNRYVAVQNLAFHQFNFSGHPAIYFSGTLFDGFTSTTVSINTTIIVK